MTPIPYKYLYLVPLLRDMYPRECPHTTITMALKNMSYPLEVITKHRRNKVRIRFPSRRSHDDLLIKAIRDSRHPSPRDAVEEVRLLSKGDGAVTHRIQMFRRGALKLMKTK